MSKSKFFGGFWAVRGVFAGVLGRHQLKRPVARHEDRGVHLGGELAPGHSHGAAHLRGSVWGGGWAGGAGAVGRWVGRRATKESTRASEPNVQRGGRTAGGGWTGGRVVVVGGNGGDGRVSQTCIGVSPSPRLPVQWADGGGGRGPDAAVDGERLAIEEAMSGPTRASRTCELLNLTNRVDKALRCPPPSHDRSNQGPPPPTAAVASRRRTLSRVRAGHRIPARPRQPPGFGPRAGGSCRRPLDLPL